MSDDEKLQERNIQTLNDIQNLQKIEQGLFNTLEQSLLVNKLPEESKDNIINKINEVSQMRINLYKGLGGMNMFFQNNLNASTNSLSEQTTAIEIVEKELNESKKRLEMIEQYKANKMRIVEINTYYGERYNEHATIMKIIIFMFLPILILAILANKGLIPQFLYKILWIVIFVIGVVMLGMTLISIANKDNMNYQEYDWYFNIANAPPISGLTTDVNLPDPWSLGNITCIGQSCCYSDSTYDSSTNKCVPNSVLTTTTTTATDTATDATANATTESFTVGQAFENYDKQNNKYKVDAYIQ